MRELVATLDEAKRRLYQIGGHSRLFWLLILLAGVGTVRTGSDAVLAAWKEHTRPKARYRASINSGVAISLNNLEKHPIPGGLLPALDIRGVLWDREADDWIIFGEAVSNRAPLPLDAVAIALRTIRLQLESPGIDIRSRDGESEADESLQSVTYFGGVQDSGVGKWFYEFDYWMKCNSLGAPGAAFAGLQDYWCDAVAQLDQQIAECRTADAKAHRRHNRYWLRTGEFKAIDGDGVLTFLETPLRVCAESYGEVVPLVHSTGRHGEEDEVDPMAKAYAQRLTALLPQLTRMLPVTQIEDFSRLLAAFTWLATTDPYRDLTYWLSVPLTSVDTPNVVSSLLMRTTREHRLHHFNASVLHRHSIEISGGVVLSPTLTRFRAEDEALLRLREALLAARPSLASITWIFSYVSRTE